MRDDRTHSTAGIVRGAALALVALASSLVAASPAGGQPGPAPVPVVRFPFPQDDGSLTPYTFELGYQLVTLVYDTLFWRDAAGIPQPWLATSAQTSPDGRRVTLKLAEGARWHDGTEVTSTDVAFTFRFMAERPHPRFTPELAAVERVETPDARTVVISLRHASPGFADQPLSDVPILPAHIWKALPKSKLAPDGLAVGSGPYRLVEHLPGQAYRFEAVPDYFRGPPAVATLEVPVITTVDETLQSLERRRADMIPVSLPEDAAARVRGLGVRTVDGPVYLGTVLMFNLRQPPFDRVEVRRAVARALDLRRIANSVGEAVPADRGYLHPESPWSSKEVLHSFDRGAAGALAGMGLGPIEVLAPDNDPVKQEAARQVVVALRRAGVTAGTRSVSRDDLSRAVGEDGSAPSFQAAIWVAPPLASYDPDFLGRLFGSNPATAALNYSGYRSPAFDALAQRVSTTADPVARQAAVQDALRLLADDLPVVPLIFSTGIFSFRPAIYDGWVFVKGVGILDKRSFVEPRSAPEGAERPPQPQPPDQGGGGSGWVGRVALAVAGLAGLAALGLLVVGMRGRAG
ncbi:MAG: hypothetical protein KY439_06275 [Actinobacteria bacterium]|nr:hypothetical protein [Actinomycetota bacterium]